MFNGVKCLAIVLLLFAIAAPVCAQEAAAKESKLATLNARFALKDNALRFVSGEGGLPCADIKTPLCTARIYLQGAHVAAWQPAGFDPVIFMSPRSVFEEGKPMRGGVPVCFPWFGSKPGDPSAPGHGFARIMEWDVESVQKTDSGDAAIVLVLKESEATKRYWNHEFVLRHRVVFGNQLSMTLEVTNTGPTPIQFAEALHSYYAVKDIRQVKLSGLDGAKYIDKVDGRKTKQQAGELTFVADTDLLFPGTTKPVTIIDPLLGRKITVEKSGSNTTSIFNPWSTRARTISDLGPDNWVGMLCVETLNVEENEVTLPPRAVHQMQARISVERL
jgi:glucose-6-phosphate 1-epimerase